MPGGLHGIGQVPARHGAGLVRDGAGRAARPVVRPHPVPALVSVPLVAVRVVFSMFRAWRRALDRMPVVDGLQAVAPPTLGLAVVAPGERPVSEPLSLPFAVAARAGFGTAPARARGGFPPGTRAAHLVRVRRMVDVRPPVGLRGDANGAGPVRAAPWPCGNLHRPRADGPCGTGRR